MSIDYIVQETVAVVLKPFDNKQKLPVLCAFHPDRSVRSTIHGLIRMCACSVQGEHVISPCYPSTYPVECKNHDCPYVIAHSIYLWVGMRREALHKEEKGGFCCTYKHQSMNGENEDKSPEVRKAVNLNRRAYEIRKQVFQYLDRLYSNIHISQQLPVIAMDYVRSYYNQVIRVMVAKQEISMIDVPARDLTSGKVAYVKLCHTDDSIFLPEEEEEQEEGDEHEEGEGHEEHEEVEEQQDEEDMEKFPPLGVHASSRVSLYKKDDDI